MTAIKATAANWLFMDYRQKLCSLNSQWVVHV